MISVRISRRAKLLGVVDLLFGNREKVNTDAVTLPRVSSAVKFARLCFKMTSTSSNNSGQHNPTSDSEDERKEIEGKDGNDHAVFYSKFRNVSLRSAAADVGRCFLASAVPGCGLRSERSVHSSSELCDVLRKISTCVHGERVCEPCSVQLHNVSLTHEDEVPSMANFCRILSTELSSLDRTFASQITTASANLIEQSLIVRKEYMKSFSEEVCSSTKLDQESISETHQRTKTVATALNSMSHLRRIRLEFSRSNARVFTRKLLEFR